MLGYLHFYHDRIRSENQLRNLVLTKVILNIFCFQNIRSRYNLGPPLLFQFVCLHNEDETDSGLRGAKPRD